MQYSEPDQIFSYLKFFIFFVYLTYMISMNISIEAVLLALSIMFFFSILAGKAGHRFGVPALLLFLFVGMLCGSDGLGIQFENYQVTHVIGTIALCIILFSGGLDTNTREIKPVIFPGIILATIGVLLTALFAGGIIWLVFSLLFESTTVSFTTSLLLASIMSCTDSASVFSILRSRGLRLKNNLRPLLEFESGSNDPIAYILVITFADLVQMNTSPDYFDAISSMFLQLIIGAALGFALGKLAIEIINRIKIENSSLYPILLLTICLFIFSSAFFVNGNAFLAVYVGGLTIGNSKFAYKKLSMSFFDGFAWLCQLLMFLTLGLLVNPHELIPIAIPAIIISILMILLVRPLSVFTSLLPFRRISVIDKLLISWSGLRGAVPIIFAIIPLTEQLPHARLIFNIVFFCTLVSLIVQGTTLPQMAKWLKLAEPPTADHSSEFEFAFSDDITSITQELIVTKRTLADGNQLKNIPLPPKTLIVMIKRNEDYFIPDGKTVLEVDDKLLVITENEDTLKQTLKWANNES